MMTSLMVISVMLLAPLVALGPVLTEVTLHSDHGISHPAGGQGEYRGQLPVTVRPNIDWTPWNKVRR